MKQMFATVAEDHVAENEANASGRRWPDEERPTGMVCSGAMGACDDAMSHCCKGGAKYNLPGRFPGAEVYESSAMAMIRGKLAKGRQRL